MRGIDVTWRFIFRFKRFATGVDQIIHGSSQLTLDDDGCVCKHIDHWDTAGELYAKLPLLGSQWAG